MKGKLMNDINEEKYYAGSAKFRDLASNGLLEELELYVYKQEDPYILYVPSKSRLARNVLSFFCTYNHKKAIENFFDSPFIKEISHIDFKDAIKGIFHNDNIQVFDILMNKYEENFTDKDMKELLTLAIENKSINIMKRLDKNSSTLTQEQQMEYFLKLLSSKESDKTLVVFHLLENKFQDIKYHQQDDILMRTAIVQKQQAVINYLLFEKKLRLTKHINALSWCDDDFAKLVQKRKNYDSMEKRSQNHLEKRNKSENNSIPKLIKKI